MKRLLLVSIFAVSSLMASPAIMGGITYNFGDSVKSSLDGAGATVKILSTSEEKKAVIAAGVSYYPWAESKKIGVDVSAGYNFKNGSVMAGWDFLKNQPSVSLGYSKEITDSDDNQFVDGVVDATCDSQQAN